ncbi:MAG: GNAT family N-acetyltransferase [Desulfobacteraceae bacterium]|nr:GNAT family N-acetyltransferase [Desulfobacteraceae bacterium]
MELPGRPMAVIIKINGFKMQKFKIKKPGFMDLTSLEIEGDRIILQSIEKKYARQIFKEFTSEITRYMFPSPSKKIEETFLFICESINGMSSGWDLVLVIIEKESGQFIGCCGFHGKTDPRKPELGIWIKKSVHGKKYGRKSMGALMAWAVENIDFDYAVYPVDKANTASRKIAEGMGGIIFEERKIKLMGGRYLDEVVYKVCGNSIKTFSHPFSR